MYVKFLDSLTETHQMLKLLRQGEEDATAHDPLRRTTQNLTYPNLTRTDPTEPNLATTLHRWY
jgi:hypothetical protein